MSAPPVTRDAWSYCGGDFYVEVSGHNRHRRATYPELQSIFADPDGSKSRPAHWYEAQLLHYGLPPSKVKGTASMRLWAAVNKGGLAVPSHIQKVETDLRKEWAKSERETKQALKKQQTAEAASSSKTTAAKKGTKRKADDAHAGAGTSNVSINLSVSIGPQGIVQFGAAPKSEPASKKAKTTKTAAVEKAPETTNTPKKTTAPKAMAAKTAAATKAAKPPTASATPKTVSAEAPPRKQTARRGASSGGNRTVSSRPAPTAAPSPAPTTHRLQLASRGRFSVPSRGGRSAARADGPPGYVTAPYEEHYDEPPPPYEEIYDHGHDYSSDDAEAIHYSGDDENFHGAPLGLLNGRYQVACRGPPEFESENDTMVLTLDGDALWGSFEIGPLTGILRFDERPRASSYAFLGFHWRAEDGQGDCHHGSDKNGGLIRFEGYGKITGQLPVDDQFLTFDGRREDGQGTRSEISAWEMRRRWDELGRPPNFTYARF